MLDHTPIELKIIAKSKVNEVEERIDEDIAHIRQWLQKQPHFNFEIDDRLILSFLRCSKFSLERTKENIDNYYTIRTIVPSPFMNRDPLLPEIQRVINSGAMCILPNLEDQSSPRTVLFSFGRNLNPDTMHVTLVVKMCYMGLDIMLMEDHHAIINGIVIVFDCQGASPKYVQQLTLPFLKNNVYMVEKGFPFRLRGIYLVNSPTFFKFAFDFTKLFFSRKIAQRMGLYLEGRLSEFWEVIPQHQLPEELGGSNSSIKKLTYELREKFENYRDWFLESEKFKTDESLRQGEPRTSSTMFGIEGSFRQLVID